jgi:putative transposase
MNIENTKDKSYHSNDTTIFSCQYHIIFCTKFRRKALTLDIQNRMKQLILDNQKKYNYVILEMEIMEDHVHLLIDCDPNIGIVKIISKIKGFSSNVLRKEFPKLKSQLPCLWTRAKFISTVGSVSLEVIKKYIENQKNV